MLSMPWGQYYRELPVSLSHVQDDNNVYISEANFHNYLQPSSQWANGKNPPNNNNPIRRGVNMPQNQFTPAFYDAQIMSAHISSQLTTWKHEKKKTHVPNNKPEETFSQTPHVHQQAEGHELTTRRSAQTAESGLTGQSEARIPDSAWSKVCIKLEATAEIIHHFSTKSPKNHVSAGEFVSVHV